MGQNKLMEMTLEEAKEYYSKYINADERLARWKENTGTVEKKPAAKKEEKADEE